MIEELTRAGLPPIVHSIRNPAEALPCCRAIRRVREHPFIIVAAGDGTFNAVLNGLGPGLATLAVLPLGTSNVLAAELGIVSLDDGIGRIVRGTTRSLAVGLLEMKEERRYFALMAGSGLDGEVVGNVRTAEKRVLRQGAFALSAVRSLFRWDDVLQEVAVEGKSIACHTAVVCNAARYGGNFRLSPDSDLFSRGLTVVCVTVNSRLGYLRIARDLFLGRPLGNNEVLLLEATELELQGNKPIQIDGDFVGRGPARITAVADFAQLIV